MKKERVLFICNHNSARSLIAEAYLNLLGGDCCFAESAGFELRPANPLVVEVMQEEGIDLSQKQPQSVFDVYRRGQAFQYVISVCSRETESNCPIFPGSHSRRFRVAFPDPAQLNGTQQEKLKAVREIRDDLKSQIAHFLQWADGKIHDLPSSRWERI